MVGTAVYQLGSNSRSQASTRSALKPGVQTVLPPAARLAPSAATRPWMWNSGMMLRQRSAAVSASVAAIFCIDACRLAWLSPTIFGRAVVPDV